MGLLIRAAAPADLERVRELTVESKAHWGYDRTAKDEDAALDDLRVDPEWIGRGLGTRLFRLAADRARELGATRLEWSGERHATGFYEKLGGRFLRHHSTEWSRTGDWMGMEL